MNFILTRDKATTIPPVAMKLSGIPDNAKLELTTLDGAVILTKSKMTTMEYVKLLTALTAMLVRSSCPCGTPVATVTSAMKTVVFTVICQSKNFADLLSPFPIGPERRRTSRPTPSWTAMWMRTPA